MCIRDRFSIPIFITVKLQLQSSTLHIDWWQMCKPLSKLFFSEAKLFSFGPILRFTVVSVMIYSVYQANLINLFEQFLFHPLLNEIFMETCSWPERPVSVCVTVNHLSFISVQHKSKYEVRVLHFFSHSNNLTYFKHIFHGHAVDRQFRKKPASLQHLSLIHIQMCIRDRFQRAFIYAV